MIDEVIAHIEANREANVERLMDLLRIPTISTDLERKGDTRRGAEWVHKLLADCGIKSEIVDTEGHPCVLADSGPVDPATARSPTVLALSHTVSSGSGGSHRLATARVRTGRDRPDRGSAVLAASQRTRDSSGTACPRSSHLRTHRDQSLGPL